MQPYPQECLPQGGLSVGVVLSSAEEKTGKDRAIAVWNIIHSVFQDLLNCFTWRHLLVLNGDECRSCCDCVPPARFGCEAQGSVQPLAPGVSSSLLPFLCPAMALEPSPHSSLRPSSSHHLTLDPLAMPDFPNTSSDSQSHNTKMR